MAWTANNGSPPTLLVSGERGMGRSPMYVRRATRAPCLGRNAIRSRSTSRTLDAGRKHPPHTEGACAPY